MVAGLTDGEQLDLALAENQRCRAAIDIARRGLSVARDRGFQEASDVIADINAALSPASPPPPPLWPKLTALAKNLAEKTLGRPKLS